MYNAKIQSIMNKYVGGNTSRTAYCSILFSYPNDNYCEYFEATGIAVCSPDDKFNKEFGLKLAEARAMQNMYIQIEKLMVEQTHKPEWKKKQKMSFGATCLKDDDCLSFVLTGIQDKDRVLKEVNRKFDAGKDIKVTIEEI